MLSERQEGAQPRSALLYGAGCVLLPPSATNRHSPLGCLAQMVRYFPVNVAVLPLRGTVNRHSPTVQPRSPNAPTPPATGFQSSTCPGAAWASWSSRIASLPTTKSFPPPSETASGAAYW